MLVHYYYGHNSDSKSSTRPCSGKVGDNERQNELKKPYKVVNAVTVFVREIVLAVLIYYS